MPGLTSINEAFNGDDSVKQRAVVTGGLVTNEQMNHLLTSYATMYNTYNSSLLHNSLELQEIEEELAEQKNAIMYATKNNKLDKHTVAGKMETSALNMNSMYYHYLVYFFIAVTLIAFIVNMLVNENANTMSATYVICALVFVYVISRYYAM